MHEPNVRKAVREEARAQRREALTGNRDAAEDIEASLLPQQPREEAPAAGAAERAAVEAGDKDEAALMPSTSPKASVKSLNERESRALWRMVRRNIGAWAAAVGA